MVPSEMMPDFQPSAGAESIRLHLAKLLKSDEFRRSPRMAQFLEYLVENAIGGGDQDAFRVQRIAVAVFGKPNSAESRRDPLVRVEAARLRSKLRDYYSGPGRLDAARIEIPARTYVPRFTLGSAAGSIHAGSKAHAGAVAVLPLDDLGNGDVRLLCAGMTEEIMTQAARIPGCTVVARTSVWHLRACEDARDFSRQLNVRWLIEGSARESGGRVRVAVRIVDAASGYQLWSEAFDGELSGPCFEFEERVASAVTAALALQLAGDQEHSVEVTSP